MSAHLVATGADVVAVGRDGAALSALEAELGPRLTTYVADVTDVARMRQVGQAAGDLDLAIANAGQLTASGPLWEVDLDDWWRGFDVNVRGVAATAQAVLPRMVSRGSGRLVLISSGVGNVPGPWATQYASSKAAVTRIGESLERELDGTGVHCFVVSPGMVRTDMTDWPPDLLRWLPHFGELPDSAWTPVDRLLALVDVIAAGGLDDLAGRFVHATDDLDALRAGVASSDARARTLRMHPAYDDDPMHR
jgi:NAD(P)-dependent dehydrogenase (short-subunit alcohol dehydrogenase family)